MLEGAEIDKSFDGGAGHITLDADEKGAVKFELSYEKDLDGYAKVKSINSVESNIFDIAAKIAAKTSTPWDDSAIAGLKKLLGIA